MHILCNVDQIDKVSTDNDITQRDKIVVRHVFDFDDAPWIFANTDAPAADFFDLIASNNGKWDTVTMICGFRYVFGVVFWFWECVKLDIILGKVLKDLKKLVEARKVRKLHFS